jgi:hypothetical protein
LITPSHAVLGDAARTFGEVDKNGRRLTLRRLTALDTLRLFKAAGPVLAQNEPWLSMASLALSVVEIDGIPVPFPVTEVQIEHLIERLGDDGLAAIARSLQDAQGAAPASTDEVGNLPGTPS